MRYIFIIIVLFFLGCSYKTAYSVFDIKKEKEIALNDIVTIKVIDASTKKNEGIIYAIYLNNIYPKKFKKTDRFYITVYLKNTNLKDYNITLNKQKPYSITEVREKNRFAKLIDIDSKWYKYYIVDFYTQKEKKLTLKIEKEGFLTTPMSFVKYQLN